MKKFAWIPILILLICLTATSAFASWTWCARDPVIRLPDGGTFHLVVAVQQEDLGSPWTLTIAAPPGSELVGGSGLPGVTVVLTDGAPGQIGAAGKPGFPVQISAKYAAEKWDAVVYDGKFAAHFDLGQ